MEMDLFLVYHDAFFKKHPSAQSIDAINNLIGRSEKAGIDHVNIRAVRVLAAYYWDQHNYEQAFEQYILLDKKLSATNVFDFPELVRDLLKIGEAYYYFLDYKNAKYYFKRIIRLPETEFNTMFMNSARNTLGLCYQKEKDYTRSDYYFNQILKTKFSEPKKIWRRIAMGNLGANCYYRNEYDKAIPLLEYDFTGAVKEADYGPAAGASILLADIFLSKGNAEKSWTYIQHARGNIAKSGQSDRLRLLYPVISKWYGRKGNQRLSNVYLDSTVLAINHYHEQFSSTKILRAQQKISLQEEKIKNSEIVLVKQQKTNERTLMTTIFAGLVVVMILGYFIYKKELNTKDLTIRISGQELDNARQDLTKFTERITENNKLIEQLQQHRTEEERNELVIQLQQSSILSEEEWHAFQRTFDKVYPGFISRARTVYTDLSLGELRYFVLCKLNLTYREMASILGVSPNSIQVLRHRIRKKFHFTDNEVLEEAIARI